MRMGKWDRNKYMGTQLTGKTLGVVGWGGSAARWPSGPSGWA
jgi:phosphoglycerate dehydrogenase-like enzyme